VGGVADPIEWDPPASAPDAAFTRGQGGVELSAEDVLAGRGRPPRRAALLAQRLTERVRALPAAVRFSVPALLVLGIAVGQLSFGREAPEPPAASSSAAEPATRGSAFAGSSLLIAKALQRAPLTDFTRPTADPGACALVRPGSSPTRSAVAAVRRALPGYRIRDSARTLDQSTGLCALDVRASDGRGSTLILEIIAPLRAVKHPFAAVNVGFTSDGTTSTSVASTVAVDGWSITAATVGPISDQPAVAAMLSLTQDPALRW
jgi:hypothetical protein